MSSRRERPFLAWPSQKAAAEELGVGRQTMRDWISGRRAPDASNPASARALARLKALGWEPPAGGRGMSSRRERPFLAWPSRKAAAEDLGVSLKSLCRLANGRVRKPSPALAAALARLKALGWEPPPYRPPARRGAPADETARRALLTVTQEELEAAERRPEGCSAARWRIELRRRARRREGWTDDDDILLPDPDTL